jgi:2-methylisocitrate lyase-like PEP mutase family enzyme
MIEVVRRIVGSVSIPVTADIEGGYGSGRPADVEDTVRRVIAVGAVGINLEDGSGSKEQRLLDTSRQVDRIGAARAAAQSEGVKLFINARVDVYLRQFGKEAGRLEESLRRAEAYIGAGADGIFIPGVIDPETIRQLAGGIRAPLNIMAGPGAPAVAELAQLGVARVSIGPSLTLSVMAHIQRAADELVRRGTYDTIEGGSPFAEVNALFSRAG